MRFALALMLVVACGGKSSPPQSDPTPSGSASEATPPAGECVKGGCSGTVCTEEDKQVMTTCEYRAEYACYASATCERQADGACGWTKSPDLAACLANPPPMK